MDHRYSRWVVALVGGVQALVLIGCGSVFLSQHEEMLQNHWRACSGHIDSAGHLDEHAYLRDPITGAGRPLKTDRELDCYVNLAHGYGVNPGESVLKAYTKKVYDACMQEKKDTYLCWSQATSAGILAQPGPAAGVTVQPVYVMPTGPR